jgi:hypothetical protein
VRVVDERLKRGGIRDVESCTHHGLLAASEADDPCVVRCSSSTDVDHENVGGGVPAKRKLGRADPAAYDERPMAWKFESAVRVPPAEWSRNDNRHATGERNLPTVGVPADAEVEVRTTNRFQSLGGMREEHAEVARARKRSARVT